MRRLINFLKNPIALPLLVLLGLCLIVVIILYVDPTKCFDDLMDIILKFLVFAQIANSIILIFVTEKIGNDQVKVQRDNIKIQLFEKRYKVYETLVNMIVFLETKDMSMSNRLLDGYKINGGTFLEFQDDLLKGTILSKSLFDKSMYIKMISIRDEFDKVSEAYFTLVIKLENLKQNSPELIENFSKKYKEWLVERDPKIKSDKSEELMADYKEISTAASEFQKSIQLFLKYMREESKILNDFDRYIIIHDLDK